MNSHSDVVVGSPPRMVPCCRRGLRQGSVQSPKLLRSGLSQRRIRGNKAQHLFRAHLDSTADVAAWLVRETWCFVLALKSETSPLPFRSQFFMSSESCISRDIFFFFLFICFSILFVIISANNHALGFNKREFPLPRCSRNWCGIAFHTVTESLHKIVGRLGEPVRVNHYLCGKPQNK